MKFKKKIVSTAVSSVIGASLLSLPMTVIADGVQLEEVLVTATRRAVAIQDVPYNISSISGDAIRKAGITDLSDLTRLAPGVAFLDQGPRVSTNSYIILRGLNANSPDGGADVPNIAQPAVSTYFGNVPAFANFNLADLERVEVLRGPQGTLYGSGSLGGTIRFIPSRPDVTEKTAEISAELSSTNEADDLNYSVDGVFNLPVSDNAAIRIAAGYRELAGFIDYQGIMAPDSNGAPVPDGFGSFEKTSVKDGNDSDDWYLRATALVDFNDKTQLLVTYQHQEADVSNRQSHSRNAPSSGITDDFEQLQAYEEPMTSELDLLAVDIEVDLGFATLSSSTSVTQQEVEWVRDATGIYDNLFYWYNTYYFPGLATDISEGDLEQDIFAQEFRLASNPEDGDRIDWVVGAYYAKQELSFSELQSMPGLNQYVNDNPGSVFPPDVLPTADRSDPTYDQTYPAWRDVEFTDMALFGELTVHITDDWQVTGGFRAFDQDFEQEFVFGAPFCPSFQHYFGVSDCGVDDADGNPTVFTPATVEDNVSDQIYKLNTSWAFSEDHSMYFTWAEGFRHGGGNAVPTSGPYPEPVGLYETFDSDKATNWEVGLKGFLMDNQLSYTLAGFYIDWEDAQFDGSTVNAGFSAVLNGGDATSTGLELEVIGQLTESLSFALGYNYTDTEWAEDVSADVLGSPLFEGDQLPGVPETMFTASVDYVVPIAMGDLFFHVNGFYRDEALGSPNEEWRDFSTIDSFSIVNTSIGLDTSTWSAKLFVDNVFDELGSSGQVPEATYGQYGYEFLVRPLTIGVGLRYNFR